MSILDLGVNSGEELMELLAKTAPTFDEPFKRLGIADSNFVKLLAEGHLPRTILNLTDEEMEALLQYGYQAISVGDFQKAQTAFTKLCQLDMLDPRYPFALGAALQLQGDVSKAAKSYLFAISLKATWPDPYVRMAECLIAADEREAARDFLETAIELAGKSKEARTIRAQAENLLTQIPKSAVAN